MNKDNKPTAAREWTLFYTTTGYSGRILVEEIGEKVAPKDYPCKFSVIEKSAYDAMKWEYENVCKFANDYEAARDALKAELEKLKGPVAMITDVPFATENITIDQRFKMQKQIDALTAENKELKAHLDGLHAAYNIARMVIDNKESE